MKEDLLKRIATCVELGKINQATDYPIDFKGQQGADELTRIALESGISPSEILNDALILGMERVGKKFAERKVFVPQMLISAKAMTAAMQHIKPYFISGSVKRKGTFVIGTIYGDLHDIGKNLVAMMIEGAGWEVIDLGVDVKPERYVETIEKYPDSVIGMSALLTTTMVNMENAVEVIKTRYPRIPIIIGGAPVSQSFCNKIGATCYASNPQEAIAYLRQKTV